MIQKKRLVILAVKTLVVVTTVFLAQSCVDERYDLKNGLSTVMKLGGDSLSLPLGSTDTIRLSDFLDTEDIEMLKVMEDGGYGFKMKDSISQSLADLLPKNIKIDDQNFSQSQSISFGDFSIDDLVIPGVSIDTAIDLVASSVSMGNFAVPAVAKTESFSAGMSDYKFNKPVIKDTTVNGGKVDALQDLKLPNNPGYSGVQLPINDTVLPPFNSTNSIKYEFSVPSGITGINSIDLVDNPKAVMEVTIELAGASSVLHSGVVIPEITINPSDLFIFQTPPTGGVITFNSSTPLNKSNNYKQTKTLNINALKMSGDPVAGKLTMQKNMIASGTMSVSGASVMSENLNLVPGIDLIVKVAVKNLAISSMDFNIPPVVSSISGNVPISINSTLPAEIKSVNKVYFNTPASISFDLKALSLPTMINRTIAIDQLSIVFPKEFVFEPALPNNTYLLSNEVLSNPAAGKQVTLNVKEMNFTGTSLTGDNKLVWNGTVNYSGKVSFNGRINSENIPTAANDPKMSMNVASALTFKSADVTTNVISKPFSPINVGFNMNVDISDQVKSLGVVNLKPGSKLRINLNKPTLPLNLRANNIIIQFPSLFKFKESLVNNSYVINGAFPELIELELSALNINKTLVNGKLSLSDVVKITGGAQLESGTVNSNDFASLDGKKLGVITSVPNLSIASTTIALNSIEAKYADTTSIDFVFNDIPTEISAIDSVILGSNANLQISIDLTNVPSMNKPLLGNLIIDFPDMILFKPGIVDSKNRMIVNKAFSNNKITINAGIRGFKFDGRQIQGNINLKEDIGFDVAVRVEDPSISSEDVSDKPVGVAVNVGLKDMLFKKFYGKVKPNVDPITESVDLSDLPDFLKNDDVVLDITKPIIALEGTSNLGIPLSATLVLKPVKNGAVIPNAQQTVTISLPKTENPAQPNVTKYWLAPESAGMPAGYQHIAVDIQKLFKSVPDKIELSVSANADQSQQHVVDLDANYALKVKYDVSLPMAFGKELSITMKDTISGIDASIGKMVSGNTVLLTGSFYNSIPLELNVKLTPLDKDNQKINIQPITQAISAGAVDGSATRSNLEIELEDPDGALKNLSGFELEFTASSNETVAGTPIKPSNFVKAELGVMIKGGVNIKED